MSERIGDVPPGDTAFEPENSSTKSIKDNTELLIAAAKRIQDVFSDAVDNEVRAYFEAGRSVHAIQHGWLVEIMPIKKVK